MSGESPVRGRRTRGAAVVVSAVLVALGVGGVVAAIDASGASGVPPPVQGESVDVSPVSGIVLVEAPGERVFRRLRAGERIPVGSTVDATSGRVRLTAARTASGQTQTADFYEGAFVVTQSRGQALTTLRLTGGSFAGCPKAGRASAASHRPRRHLWGSGAGSYRSQGTYSAASVHGTVWNTADECDGTRVTDKRGSVHVSNPYNNVDLTADQENIERWGRTASGQFDYYISVQASNFPQQDGVPGSSNAFFAVFLHKRVRQYQLCILAPSGKDRCQTFLFFPSGSKVIRGVGIVSCDQQDRPGTYVARWLVGGRQLGVPLSFSLTQPHPAHTRCKDELRP